MVYSQAWPVLQRFIHFVSTQSPAKKAICNNGGKYQRRLFDLKLLSRIKSGDWSLSVTDIVKKDIWKLHNYIYDKD